MKRQVGEVRMDERKTVVEGGDEAREIREDVWAPTVGDGARAKKCEGAETWFGIQRILR